MRSIDLKYFVVARIILSFNRKLLLCIESRVQFVTINTLENLTEMLQREWINTKQNLISQCINPLHIVLDLQNI